MKQLSEALKQSFSEDALTSCHCWRLTRRDSTVIGVTDHDQDLDVDGLVYSTNASLQGSAFLSGLGLKPGRASANGVLSLDAITEQDLLDGKWDRARIDVSRVNWSATELGGAMIWSGYLTEISVGESGIFEAELVSLKADFERLVGRVFTRRCTAILGDSRCRVVVADGAVCDKSLNTCHADFDNVENFQGFPNMPGPDFVLAGPAATGNDGGKRS